MHKGEREEMVYERGDESGIGTYTEDPNMNLITQYGLRLLVLVFELGLGLVLYYRIGSSLCVPSAPELEVPTA